MNFNPKTDLGEGWEWRKSAWVFDTEERIADWVLERPYKEDGVTRDETTWHLRHRQRVAARLYDMTKEQWEVIKNVMRVPT